MARHERFIPFRRTDLVHLCAADAGFDAVEAKLFNEYAEILAAYFHFEFHARLERLKDAYAPFDPDRDTRRVRQWSDDALSGKETRFIDDLRAVLEAANFTPIERADLERAMAVESLFKVRLHVSFDDFAEVLFFRRGESLRRERINGPLGLWGKEIAFTNYDRVVVYVRFKEEAALQDGSTRRNFEPGSVMLKVFQNVPEADLEMLFPNTEVRMKTVDKLAIGVPAAGGIVAIASKLSATVVLLGAAAAFWLGLRDEPVELDQPSLIALATGLGALGGYLWKQFSNFKNRKIRFMKALADNLYFRNLDNNVGVIHRLIDEAEEEESKEALLAAFFLQTRGEATAAELDERVEDWFLQTQGCALDFEVADAVAKLHRLGLAHKGEGDRWRALSLAEGRRRLDALWDGAFDFPVN